MHGGSFYTLHHSSHVALVHEDFLILHNIFPRQFIL